MIGTRFSDANIMSQHIPATMYAWRKHAGNEQPQWDEVPVPATPKTGYLCKVLAAGICHSDHAMMIDRAPRPWFQEKYTMGHEGCGQVIDIGPEVKDNGIRPVRTSMTLVAPSKLLIKSKGDIISMFAVPGCGSCACYECSQGIPQLCETGHHSGIGQDGFFASFATIDERGAVLVPVGTWGAQSLYDFPGNIDSGINPATAAVATDAVTTAYHAVVRRGEVKAHETVMIFGLGGLGFNGLQIVKNIGARVVVTDIRQERLDAAIDLGVPKQDVIPIGTSPVEFILEKGIVVDTTLDFVGANKTFNDAQQIVHRAGKMVCVGTLSLDNTINMKLGVRKRLTILFSYGGQVQDLREVLDMIADGGVTPQVETDRLQAFPARLKDLCDGKAKARIALTPESP